VPLSVPKPPTHPPWCPRPLVTVENAECRRCLIHLVRSANHHRPLTALAAMSQDDAANAAGLWPRWVTLLGMSQPGRLLPL
jgi:hypothetical protein